MPDACYIENMGGLPLEISLWRSPFGDLPLEISILGPRGGRNWKKVRKYTFHKCEHLAPAESPESSINQELEAIPGSKSLRTCCAGEGWHVYFPTFFKSGDKCEGCTLPLAGLQCDLVVADLLDA